jgi:hypothetical protein
MSLHVGIVRAVLTAQVASGGDESFVTAPTGALELTLDGIPGDRHGGQLRRANARDPWLKRGVGLRNDRQVSALSVEELATIAAALNVAEASPELVGANLLVEGLADFSRIPAGSHLCFGGVWGGKGTFDGAAILKVEAYNKPCRGPGRKLAAAHGRPELEFGFVKAAHGLRGLVLSVSLPGVIRVGDQVVLVPGPSI